MYIPVALQYVYSMSRSRIMNRSHIMRHHEQSIRMNRYHGQSVRIWGNCPIGPEFATLHHGLIGTALRCRVRGV